MGYDSVTQKLIIVNQKRDPVTQLRTTTHLYTVDPATAAVTFVADTGAVGMTDVYDSHTSSSFYATANAPDRFMMLTVRRV